MNWYYANGGQQMGPVSDAELQDLVASRVILNETLVWHEGLAAWQPYSSVRPAEDPSAATTTATSPGSRCAECGKVFPLEETLEIAGRRVCATCKPVYLQRLQEGAAPAVIGGVAGGTGDQGALTPEQILARDYDVDPGERVSEAWRLLFDQPGIYLLGGALVLLLVTVVQSASSFLCSIFGGIIAMFLVGPLLGGLLQFYVRRHRGETLSLGDAFSGFGPRFGSLSLANAVPSLLEMLAWFPGVALLFGFGIFVSSRQGNPSPALFGLGLGGVLCLAGVLCSLWLSVIWMYVLPLVADKKCTLGAAMRLSRQVVQKHFWQHLWLGILRGAIMIAGVMACGIGWFVAAPVSCCMLSLQYNRLFGDMAPQGT